MALSLLTNTAALAAQANLSKTNSALSNSFSRLSTGFRVSSQDDAAGLAIAAKLKADTAAQMSTRSGALNLSQSLGGNLDETRNVLSRMQDLARHSLDDSYTAADRDKMNAEFTQLKDYAGQLANTQHNGQSWLVKGSDAPKSITVGGASLDQSQVALIGSSDPEDGILTRSYDGVSFSSDAFNISGASTGEQREGVLKALQGMVSGVNTAQYALGTFQNGLSLEDLRGPASTDDGTYTRSGRVTDVPDMEFEKLDRLGMRAGITILAGANTNLGLLSLLRG